MTCISTRCSVALDAADRAWPLYEENQWKWVAPDGQERVPTPEALADVILSMIERVGSEHSDMAISRGRLCVSRESTGNGCHYRVSVELGTHYESLGEEW